MAAHFPITADDQDGAHFTDEAVMSRCLSPLRLLKQCDQFVEFLALRVRVAAADGVLDAMVRVVLQHESRSTPFRAGTRGAAGWAMAASPQ